LSIDQVLAGINQRPPKKPCGAHGRNAPEELIERADLVTEMSLIKHPLKLQRIRAQSRNRVLEEPDDAHDQPGKFEAIARSAIDSRPMGPMTRPGRLAGVRLASADAPRIVLQRVDRSDDARLPACSCFGLW